MAHSSKKIGLALGGGSSRGWAHFGVIQALSELGIQIDCVAGTSIGALVGALFAAGAAEKFLESAPQFAWKRLASFFDLTSPWSGLIDGKKVADFLRDHVQAADIRDLPVPFAAVAVDLRTGKEVILDSGDLMESVRASMAFPGVLTPVARGETFLLDGGLVNPVPVSVVRKMGADYVIAVDLNHDVVAKKGAARAGRAHRPRRTPLRWARRKLSERGPFLNALNERFLQLELPVWRKIRSSTGRDAAPNIFEVLFSSISIMESQITTARLRDDPPDLLLQPQLGHIRFLEFHRAKEGIQAGYEEAMLKLSEGL
jgi:NTE family protein